MGLGVGSRNRAGAAVAEFHRKLEHLPELDGLRGIAILMVMSFHFLWFAEGFGLFRISPAPLPQWLVALQYCGWAGVDLFFALSGFLITRILTHAKGRAGYFRNFYGRRILRIFPAYYTLLALWMLSRHWLPADVTATSDPTYPAWLSGYATNVLLTLQGWFCVPVPLRHLWSLAIEEQFYLLWPLMLHLLSQRQSIFACVGLIGLSPLLRVWYTGQGWGLDGAFLLMPCRLDSLAAGALIALLSDPEFHSYRLGRYLRAAAAIALVLLVMLFVLCRGLGPEDRRVVTWGLLLLSILFASLVGLAAARDRPARPRRLLNAPWLRWFGQYSYGLYLWHQPVCVLLYARGFMALLARTYTPQWPGVFLLLIYATPLLASMAVAWISWRFCEEPLLRLKSRFPLAG